MSIPWINIQKQNAALRDEILPLWDEILTTGQFVGGQHVQGFEEEYAAAHGTQHCCAVSNGTDALRLIFHALDVQPGDEIITAPNTFIATTESIIQVGGKAVFADIDPVTYNIDPAAIEAAITPRTKGIVPVHLYGQMADMDPIVEIARRHNLWVVEDAAQAQLAEYKGRKAGSIGVAGAFSFYPGKNLGACGEAGAVTTNSEELAAKIRMLRDHGQAQKYYHDLNGYNNRCDALQAAALRVKLKKLPEWNESRRKLAARYEERLRDQEGITLPRVAQEHLPIWHLFVILSEKRDELHEALKERDIATSFHYPIPLHLQKAYTHMGYKKGDFPVAERVAEQLLTLPMFPELTEQEVDQVADALIETLAGEAVAAK